MAIPQFILNYFPRGKILLTESNPKNFNYFKTKLQKHRLKAIPAASLQEAQEILDKTKVLGVIVDHKFSHDTEHTGIDLVHFIRRKRAEALRGLPVFVVADIETAVLLEYEYLKVNQYFDTTTNRVGYVVSEMEPYFIERD